MTTLTLYIALGTLLIGFGGGVLVDHKFHLAGETVQAKTETKAAQAGEVKIIHDTNVITKVIHDSNDKCTATNVPDAINAGLR